MNVDETLRLTTDEGLLTTFAALTHQMHATTDLLVSADLRAQRDRVQVEILRRMRVS